VDSAEKNTRLRQLPSVDELLARPFVVKLLSSHPRQAVVRALRTAVDRARARLLAGEAAEVGERELARALAADAAPRLRQVINATGVVLHTNLGRAPLAEPAIQRIADLGSRYTNLELDLDRGERGHRFAAVEGLLCDLTGAEAAAVVNNNAAAVLVVLTALAQGREVIVSRGEAVEIGGGFRIPDVMRQSGALLVEVGTTNKTRLADYEEAITDDTALILKVHKSNFAVVGFTAEASAAEIAGVASAKNIPVFEDLGSGCLVDLSNYGLPKEPTVSEALAAGADVVSFSGDKLLGGPQAGVIVGRRDLVKQIASHPLARAVRIDKFTIAALEATLRLYRDGRESDVPVIQMLSTPAAALQARALRLRDCLQRLGTQAEIVETDGQVGGGALPLAKLPSNAVRLTASDGPDALAARLRAAEPPAMGRIHEDGLLLDVRTVADDEVEPLAASAAAAVLAGAPVGGHG
jgi:L-seryl-tRNA(Ser) seleniumtransferase